MQRPKQDMEPTSDSNHICWFIMCHSPSPLISHDGKSFRGLIPPLLFGNLGNPYTKMICFDATSEKDLQ